MKLINGMDFVNDEQSIGKWVFFDVISSIDDFDSSKQTNKEIPFGYKEVYFMPNGQGYWIFEGWSKNKLLVCHGGDDPILCFDYAIKQVKSQLFMLIEVTEDATPYFVVLKKQDSKNYCIEDIKKKDNINLPFVFDSKIIGSWQTVSFVDKIEDFNPNQKYQDTLWLVSATFNPDGTATRKYFDTEWQDKWTKGKLLDQKKSIVSNYIFKTINSKEYLFLEWKMGNYVYGGMPASYYVFVKQ